MILINPNLNVFCSQVLPTENDLIVLCEYTKSLNKENHSISDWNMHLAHTQAYDNTQPGPTKDVMKKFDLITGGLFEIESGNSTQILLQKKRWDLRKVKTPEDQLIKLREHMEHITKEHFQFKDLGKPE